MTKLAAFQKYADHFIPRRVLKPIRLTDWIFVIGKMILLCSIANFLTNSKPLVMRGIWSVKKLQFCTPGSAEHTKIIAPIHKMHGVKVNGVIKIRREKWALGWVKSKLSLNWTNKKKRWLWIPQPRNLLSTPHVVGSSHSQQTLHSWTLYYASCCKSLEGKKSFLFLDDDRKCLQVWTYINYHR